MAISSDESLSSGFRDLGPAEGEQGRPKYERLREYIVNQIESGQLKAGMALPSEHRLADVLQIARSTVRQAMASLERDGLVRRVHGRGTYVHDDARRRLSPEQGLLALIVPETQAGFYPSLQRSFEEAATKLHKQVIVCNSNNEVDRQGNSILQLIDHRVAGVAIVPTTNPPTPAFHIRQLQQHDIPVVCCSRRIDGVQAPLLAIPFEEVGRRAGQAIREAGHTRVAYIGTERSTASEAYERGFRAAMRRAGEGLIDIQVFYDSVATPDVAAHESEVAAALDKMFSHGEGPTAIFASFDSLAELIYVLLSRRGLRVPEDVSLVGFGGSVRNGALARRLTSVTIDEIRLGREAVELLDQMRHGELPIDTSETREIPLGLSNGSTLAHFDHATSTTGGEVMTGP